MATLKGGSGKSTAAACLACHSMSRGLRVTLIDADPQGSLTQWHALGEPLLDIDLRADISEAVGHHAQAAAEQADLVVVDTAGFRNRTMIDALSAADLAVVPIKASPLDIAVAIETLALVAGIAALPERKSHPLTSSLLLTQNTGGSAVARHVRDQLRGLGYQMFDAELINRVGYGEAALAGRLPLHVSPKSAAARDCEVFTDEVWGLLNLTRKERD
jgi:chromosome partitioning protein